MIERVLEGKQALVTGAGRGIGAGIALALAKAGADVVIIDIQTEGLEKTKKQIEKIGRHCLALEVDLAKPQLIEKAVKQLLEYRSVWDIVVNNAATVRRGPLTDLSLEEWNLVFDVNIRAVFLLSRAIAPTMMKKGGKIIHISSNASFFGTPGSGAYAASKAALNQLTKTMAIEWGPHNIQVNLVCPGLVDTELMRTIWDAPQNSEMKKKFMAKIPLGRLAKIEEITPAVLFLAGPGSDYINGTMITIDGGARYNPI